MKLYNNNPTSYSAARKGGIPSNPSQNLVGSFGFRVLFLLAAHVVLVFFIGNSSIFSTLHVLLTLIIGLFFLLTDKQPFRLIYLMGYITGAELLWRGTHAQVFWEIGKYAIIFFSFFGLLRYRVWLTAKKSLLLYFLLLLPSLFVMTAFDREQIAFALAGPLALAVASMFFSAMELERDQLKNLFLAVLAPTISLGVLVASGIINASVLSFAQGSLYATSGGIGPNQVSSILGLGAVAAFFFAVLESKHKFLRFLVSVIAIWLLAQTVLTFARGGFWTAVAAIFVAGIYLIQDKRTRNTFFILGILMFLIGNYIVYPALDRFTSGALTTRFSSFDSTGRYEIAQSDWVVFLRNPIFGVGPDQSNKYHAMFFREASAHTEYTRMLSEHGIFGLLALLILAMVSFRRLISPAPALSKAFILGMTTWALLFMLHSATRLVAPSFLFGLAAATFVLQEQQESEIPQPSAVHAVHTAKYRARGWK